MWHRLYLGTGDRQAFALTDETVPPGTTVSLEAPSDFTDFRNLLSRLPRGRRTAILEAPEARDQIGFLLGGQTDTETGVIEIHGSEQASSAAIVEIRRACWESTQRRDLEFTDVRTGTGHQGSARIRYGERLSGERTKPGFPTLHYQAARRCSCRTPSPRRCSE